jgi:hypothetical protein
MQTKFIPTKPVKQAVMHVEPYKKYEFIQVKHAIAVVQLIQGVTQAVQL